MSPEPDRDRRDAIRSQALARAMAEFSARAGHDLLGPLNQAGSLLALFVERYGNRLDAEADVLLGFLQSSSVRMQGVVAGVLAHLDVAGSAPSVAPVDMNVALAAARLSLAKAIAESAAAIAPETLPVVAADANRMAAIFEILLGNAIKFRHPSEPPRIHISAERVTSENTGASWLFACEDNGLGIDAEYREAVFLPFRRLHGKEYPGAGLGLATAKLIVELHGGRIWIEPASRAGYARGAAVVFTLPD